MKDNHQKHLTLSDRIIIEKGLDEGKTFAAIATAVGKDPTTISKEVRKHRTLKQRKDKSVIPRCAHEKTVRLNAFAATAIYPVTNAINVVLFVRSISLGSVVDYAKPLIFAMLARVLEAVAIFVGYM